MPVKHAFSPSGRENPIKGEAIIFTGITKRFGAVVGVDHIDLQVEAGEFLSLLGPSGSGKTTLLMMLAGFETPSSGSITLGGRDLTHVPPNKRGIGMVFQRYALFPHMSVAQNVAFPLKMRGLGKDEVAPLVEQALARVRLQDYGDRMPAQLSGGQQQRVAVARALVFQPPVLLMDEPLGALDKKLREELQIEIKKLHESLGVTIIYVTHDQEEALTMSDRIAVMNCGRVEQIGTPEEIYECPTTSFVADFIGVSNLMPATVIEATGLRARVRLDAGVELDTAMTRLEQGDRCHAVVRPERLRVAGREGARGGAPGVDGTVVATVYLGSAWQVVVRLHDDVEVVVLLLNTGEDERSRLPSPGSAAHVSWSPDDLHVVRESTAEKALL